VTPLATKRTALEKHGGANPRAIMDGKPFDVENDARGVEVLHGSLEHGTFVRTDS